MLKDSRNRGFGSHFVGLSVLYCELFGGRSRYKESSLVGLEGLVRNRAATGTRLPLTLRLCPNVERSISGAMGHCGARHSVI